jgi:leader peptidase (prepilin peptidase)/N-methyltransferase
MASLVACYGLIALISCGGIGLGDVRLAGLLGLSLGWTGWHAVILATMLAFCVGGLVGLAVLATGRPRDTDIPFGPIMTGTALVVLAVSM